MVSNVAGCGGDDTTQVGSGDDGGDAIAQGDGSGGDDGAAGDGTLGDGAHGDGATGDGANGDGANGDGGACVVVGMTCAMDGDCCTANCNLQLHVCANPVGVCKQAGVACATSNECCTFVCDGTGHCGSQLCISDNQACTSNASCCGGVCSGTDGGAGTCTPLNPACSTSGNTCSTSATCCSHLCTNGRCSSQSSFCTQTGDVCSTNTECCGGICTKQGTNTLGVCGIPRVTGTPQCTVSGEACGATPDGGIVDGGTVGDAGTGIPACGGNCCSRACAPFGPTGVDICEPPSGCRPTGELCRVDDDCCGAPGTPTGGADSNVHCSKANSNDPVGRCDNGNVCSPAGNICRLASNSCNATDRCCAGTVQTHPYLCKQDNLGIPRCTITGVCPDSGTLQGQPCASSADCCGLACVPNHVDGGAPFVCGATCEPTCAGCTTTADCCQGLACVLPPGSSSGTCGTSACTPDGGVIDSGTPNDGGTSNDGGTGNDGASTDSGVCSLYGQLCSVAADCCDGLPCTNGRCEYPIP
jgi:hypothetical protein